MNCRTLIILSLLCSSLFAVEPKRLSSEDIKITKFGAIADAKTLNHVAIQTAIDIAEQQGGGRVIIPPGIFLSGSIVMKSNVELHLQKGATLLGTIDPHQYKGLNRWKALVLAYQVENISITGEGLIDGQGRELALNMNEMYYRGELPKKDFNVSRSRYAEHLRPQVIEFEKCKNIRVSDVHIKDGACWVTTYSECENLVINNVTINSDAFWNNDGMDIDDCKNVRITNCYVNSADDGICLKSHDPSTFNEDILVADCTVRSSASAIKFGTASRGGFKNVTIKNIKVFDTYRSAIAIESVDGGNLENIVVDGIDAKNTGNAIFVRLGHRNVLGKVGTLKNVTIKNVKAQIAFDRPDRDYELRGPALSFFHNPIPASITGVPGHYVKNVCLENIAIVYPGRGNTGLAYLPLNRLNDVPENEGKYPEFSMFKELPAWGLYVRHVRGLSMKNVSMEIQAADYRPALVMDDVANIDLKTLDLPTDKKTQIYVKDGKELSFDAQAKSISSEM